MATDLLFVNLPPYESYYADGVPHLGMLYVMTNLRQHGYVVGYLDCARRTTRRQQVIDGIREAQPRVVAFSVDTDNIYSVGRLTRVLKQEFGNELLILLGGPASQGQPEEIMQRSAADVLVIGEGEYAAVEVADCLLRGRGTLASIDGICYRDADNGGALAFTTARDPIADLDAVPIPDRSFLPPGRQYEASIITGRGCPFRCTFCFEGRMGNRYRHRSPENILKEIDHLIQVHRRPFICINDDTFTADVAHTLELCSRIRERYVPWRDVLFFAEVRVDVVARHPELIDALVGAGVARIQIGVESADREVLRAFKRLNVRPELVEDIVGRFHRAGMTSIYAGFIVGGPGETEATAQTTLDFALHLLRDVAPGSFECNASFLTPLPGTELRTNPAAYGLRLLDPDLKTSSNFNFCVAETQALSKAQINNFRQLFASTIDRTIIELVPSLPRELVERHGRLQNDFGVTTRYAERFRHYPRLAEYLGLVGDSRFDPASALSDDELLSRFPTRLTAGVEMHDDRLTVLHGPTRLTLNTVGSRVLELSSGKLTGHEVVDEIANELGAGAPPRVQLARDVVTFLRHLDENYAVFLKDF